MTLPASIGRYEIRGKLGEGGMATVYRGFDSSFRREVAIKVLPEKFIQDKGLQERFLREARIVAQLEHEAIVPVYDVGEIAGQPYIVMRLMPGGSLSDLLRDRSLSLAETAEMMRRLAGALDEAHSRGIIHRDLKPGNILLDRQGRPYIADFGIAKFTEATQQFTGSGIIGTPLYMSPEQGKGDDLTGASDIYSLGVIFYQMLSGKLPYVAESAVAVVIKHMSDPIPSLTEVRPDLPSDIDVVLRRVMAKYPEQRYQHASDFVADIDRVLRGEDPDVDAGGTAILPGSYTEVEMEGGEAIPTRKGPYFETQVAPTRPARPGEAGVSAQSEAAAVPRPRSKLPPALIIGGGLLVLTLLLGGGGLIVMNFLPQASSQAEVTPGLEAGPSTLTGEQSPEAPVTLSGGAQTELFTANAPPGADARLGRGRINASALSPDRSWIAVGASIGVFAYDAQPFADRWFATTPEPVSAAAISPDASLVAAGQPGGEVLLIDAASGEIVNSLGGLTGVTLSLDWSPTGQTLAAGSEGGTILVWDAASGEELASLRGHTDQVLSLAWSPDGTRLASGSADRSIVIWDRQTGQALDTLEGHENWVFDLAWAADGRSLYSAGYDGQIIAWEIATGEAIRSYLGHPAGVTSLALSPNGISMASGGSEGGILIWDLASARQQRSLRGHSSWVAEVDWSADGGRLYSTSFDNSLIAWDAADATRLETLYGHTEAMTALALSGDGRLASAHEDGSVTLWDPATREFLSRLPLHEAAINQVIFAGDALVTASADRTVGVWDASSGGRLHSLEGFSSAVQSVAYSPDFGQIAAAGCAVEPLPGQCQQGQVLRWELASGGTVGAPLSGHLDLIWQLAWASEGLRLASAGRDGDVIVWDTRDDQPALTFTAHEGAVQALAFAPDGLALASGDTLGIIRIWDSQTGAERLTLTGHSAAIRSLAFSPAGDLLASGGGNGDLILWDAASGERLRTLEGHTAALTGIVFLPGGAGLASASSDGTILIWTLD